MSRLWTDDERTDGRTECEDRARILETEFAIINTIISSEYKVKCFVVVLNII